MLRCLGWALNKFVQVLHALLAVHMYLKKVVQIAKYIITLLTARSVEVHEWKSAFTSALKNNPEISVFSALNYDGTEVF